MESSADSPKTPVRSFRSGHSYVQEMCSSRVLSCKTFFLGKTNAKKTQACPS